jgi:hypothetical protein
MEDYYLSQGESIQFIEVTDFFEPPARAGRRPQVKTVKRLLLKLWRSPRVLWLIRGELSHVKSPDHHAELLIAAVATTPFQQAAMEESRPYEHDERI